MKAPSSKFQVPKKSQIPNPKSSGRGVCEFGIWDFFGTWNLELGTFLLMLGISVLCAGCSTTPNSASFASVVIQGKSAEDIRQATVDVFQTDGYRVLAPGPGTMVFQREGTRAQALAYNGIIGTHYGENILVRVRADIVDLGAESQRLQCQAYIVRSDGDPFFEEETRLSNMKGGPYQKLLNQVEEKLK